MTLINCTVLLFAVCVSMFLTTLRPSFPRSFLAMDLVVQAIPAIVLLAGLIFFIHPKVREQFKK